MRIFSPNYLHRYPDDVPAGTAIPNWAFLDVTTADTFNALAAQADGGGALEPFELSSYLTIGHRYT